MVYHGFTITSLKIQTLKVQAVLLTSWSVIVVQDTCACASPGA